MDKRLGGQALPPTHRCPCSHLAPSEHAVSGHWAQARSCLQHRNKNTSMATSMGVTGGLQTRGLGRQPCGQVTTSSRAHHLSRVLQNTWESARQTTGRKGKGTEQALGGTPAAPPRDRSLAVVLCRASSPGPRAPPPSLTQASANSGSAPPPRPQLRPRGSPHTSRPSD